MKGREDREPVNYTYRSMREERRYGLYWYSGIWAVLRPILVAVTALLIVLGIAMSIWNKLYGEFAAPADPTDPTPVIFEVQSGQSLARVSNNLEKAGLIRSHTVFKYYCDFSGFGQNIQSGTYTLDRTMTIDEIADQLTRGDGNPLVANITLVPGWTVEEFADYLVKKGLLADTKEFLELCRTGTEFSNYYYIADVLSSKNVSQRKYVLEGYLAPNTYEIYTSATPKEMIRKLLSQTESAFPADLQDVATDAGFTMDQIITLASMIEKEAKTADFAKVSAVFRNRLNKNMPLGSDVTIHYITGVRKMALTDSDLAVKSPYNTYRNNGLPLGPICSPSVNAITAALYPDETYIAEGYLYFCAKDPESGELVFSKTLTEHERAVAMYEPQWKQYDQERGIQ